MQRPRTPSNLSESLHQRLNSYALAASAAGVGLLALAQPSEARIVYTPASVTFGGGSHGKFGGSYYFDLNHDGIRDFEFAWRGISSYRSISEFFQIQPTGKNGIAGKASSWHYAFCLGSGASIGPRQPFAGTVIGSIRAPWSGGHGIWLSGTSNGGQGNVEGYLGLKFRIHGQTHYGWARLNVLSNWGPPAFLTVALLGYAYKTTPNKPIIAGKTHGKDEATLGHLASGASAIPARRVKPTAATTH